MRLYHPRHAYVRTTSTLCSVDSRAVQWLAAKSGVAIAGTLLVRDRHLPTIFVADTFLLTTPIFTCSTSTSLSGCIHTLRVFERIGPQCNKGLISIFRELALARVEEQEKATQQALEEAEVTLQTL